MPSARVPTYELEAPELVKWHPSDCGSTSETGVLHASMAVSRSAMWREAWCAIGAAVDLCRDGCRRHCRCGTPVATYERHGIQRRRTHGHDRHDRRAAPRAPRRKAPRAHALARVAHRRRKAPLGAAVSRRSSPQHASVGATPPLPRPETTVPSMQPVQLSPSEHRSRRRRPHHHPGLRRSRTPAQPFRQVRTRDVGQLLPHRRRTGGCGQLGW